MRKHILEEEHLQEMGTIDHTQFHVHKPLQAPHLSYVSNLTAYLGEKNKNPNPCHNLLSIYP